jgi:AP-2 complex subunit alpha
MIRLTIRATDESVPAVLLKLMVDRLTAGTSTVHGNHVPPTHREISDAFSNVMVN